MALVQPAPCLTSSRGEEAAAYSRFGTGPFGKLPYRHVKLDLTSGSFKFSTCSPFFSEQILVIPWSIDGFQTCLKVPWYLNWQIQYRSDCSLHLLLGH